MTQFLTNLRKESVKKTKGTGENVVYKLFKNIVGKGENAGNQQFFSFSTIFSAISKLSSANAFNLEKG